MAAGKNKLAINGKQKVRLYHYTLQPETGLAREKPRKNRSARDGGRRAEGRIR